MVFYRKYRSQCIDELDNEEVRQKLTAILQDPPHAFLFTGPKGLGKTSTARIVAKIVNCLQRAKSVEQSAEGRNEKTSLSSKLSALGSIEPCNICESCISITNGTHMDILEIDAASNRGIDEIRELKDKIRLAPLSAKKKVYIIDEVHMLTTEAFNALLKTLEEPPSHALFILCTTESHKVPSTILSRSFHIGFHLATEDELIRSFKRIVLGEKLEVEEEALREIAQLSEGGFRDGAKIFEELVALTKGQKITVSLVQEKYQTTGLRTAIDEILTAFATSDTQKGLGVIAQLIMQGTDLKYFLQTMSEMLHSEFLRRHGIEQGIGGTSAVLQEFDESALKEILQVLVKVQFEMRGSVIPQLPLELAIVEWTGGNKPINKYTNKPNNNDNEEVVTVKETNDSAKQNSEVKIETEKVKITAPGEVSVATLRKQVGNIAKIKALYGEPKETKEIDATEIIIKTTDLTTLHIANDKEITKEWVDEFWRCLISEMKNHNHTLAGVLRGCMPKSFDRKSLIIETAFNFHKEKLDDHKTKQMLEQVCKGLTGLPISVSIAMKSN